MKLLKVTTKMDNRGSINDINGITRPTARRPLVAPSRVTAGQARPQPVGQAVTPTVKPTSQPKSTELIAPGRPEKILESTTANKAKGSNKPWIILTVAMAAIAVIALGSIAYMLMQSE